MIFSSWQKGPLSLQQPETDWLPWPWGLWADRWRERPSQFTQVCTFACTIQEGQKFNWFERFYAESTWEEMVPSIGTISSRLTIDWWANCLVKAAQQPRDETDRTGRCTRDGPTNWLPGLLNSSCRPEEDYYPAIHYSDTSIIEVPREIRPSHPEIIDCGVILPPTKLLAAADSCTLTQIRVNECMKLSTELNTPRKSSWMMPKQEEERGKRGVISLNFSN